MRRRGSLRSTTRSATVSRPPDEVWTVVASGATGSQWYVDAAPFRFRGALDRLVGGAGSRWAPPGRDRLEAGDRAGFWQVVVADHAAHRLVLEARLRAPGRVRVETRVRPATQPDTMDRTTIVHQTTTFDPEGLVGVAYLLADLPARAVVAELTMLHLLTALRRER